jgi:hypothetical protein
MHYPRPQFQPNAAIPMVDETHRRLALQLRMAGESLIGQPTADAYNVLSKMLAALNRARMPAAETDPGTDIMNRICDRFEALGALTVRDDEAAALRTALAGIDAALPRIPVNRFARAVAEVEAFFTADAAANYKKDPKK